MNGSETDFAQQLQSDEGRALKEVSPSSTAAQILRELYPQLRGPLHPKRKSGEIARNLDTSIQTGLPVNVFAVLALPTTRAELPYLVQAVRSFMRPGVIVNPKAILVDWPERATTQPRSVTANKEEIQNAIVQTGMFGEVINLNLERSDLDNPDSKLREWLVSFYLRQESMASVHRIAGFEADVDLAMRQKIGKTISQVSVSGLKLGLTTELNPRLLRCYGKGVYLANVDVTRN